MEVTSTRTRHYAHAFYRRMGFTGVGPPVRVIPPTARLTASAPPTIDRTHLSTLKYVPPDADQGPGKVVCSNEPEPLLKVVASPTMSPGGGGGPLQRRP